MFWRVLALVTFVRVVVAAVLPLSLTEPYYVLWSRHLATGYYDHPPLVAWMGAPFTFLGTSPLAARLPVLLASVACALLVRAYGAALTGDRRTGDAAGVIALLVPYLSVMAVLDFPEGGLLMAWAWVLLAWHRALFEEGSWVLAGVSLGVALLAKFTAFALVAGLALVFLLSPAARARWRGALLALLTAGLVYSPFLLWSAAHDWQTFAFQFRGRLTDAPSSHLESFLVELMAGVSPGLFLALPFAIAWAWRRLPRGPVLLALALSLPVLVSFTLVSLRVLVQVYWVLCGLLGLLPMVAGWFLERLQGPHGRAWRRAGWGAAFLAVVPFLVCAVAALHPPLLFAVSRHPGGLTELYAIPGAARMVGDERARMPRPDQTFLAAEDYRLASHLTLLTGEPAVMLTVDVRGLEYERWQDLSALAGQDAVVLHRDPSEPWELGRRLRAAFDVVEATDMREIRYGESVAQVFFVTRCRGFHPDRWHGGPAR